MFQGQNTHILEIDSQLSDEGLSVYNVILNTRAHQKHDKKWVKDPNLDKSCFPDSDDSMLV